MKKLLSWIKIKLHREPKIRYFYVSPVLWKYVPGESTYFLSLNKPNDWTPSLVSTADCPPDQLAIWYNELTEKQAKKELPNATF